MVQTSEKKPAQKRHHSMSLKTDLQLYAKLKYIAQVEGRSINQQVNYVVRQWVQAYEKARGPVDVVGEEN